MNLPVTEMATESKEIFIKFLNWFLLEDVVNPPPLIKSTHRDILFLG